MAKMHIRNQDELDDSYLKELSQTITAGHVPSINSEAIAALTDADLISYIQCMLMLKKVETSFLDDVLVLFWDSLEKPRVKTINWQHDDLAALIRLANFKYCYQFVNKLMLAFYQRIKRSNEAIVKVFGAIDVDVRKNVYRRCVEAHHHSSVEAILTFLSLLPVKTHQKIIFYFISNSLKSFRPEELLKKWLDREDLTVQDICTSEMASYFARVQGVNQTKLLVRLDRKVADINSTKRVAKFYYKILSRMNNKFKPDFAIRCLYKLMGSDFNYPDEALTSWWKKAADTLVTVRIDDEFMLRLVRFANSAGYHLFLASFVKTYFRYMAGNSELITLVFLAEDPDKRENLFNICMDGSNIPNVDNLQALLRPTFNLSEKRGLTFCIVRAQMLSEIDHYRSSSHQ